MPNRGYSLKLNKLMNKSELVINEDHIYHLGLNSNQINPNLIFVGDPARAYRVADHFAEIKHQVQHREFVTLSGTYNDVPISVIGTGIGTDNVEIALVEAYALLAFDLKTQRKLKDIPTINVMRLGTSGGIQPTIDAGTMAITTYALGLDSTGLFYDHVITDPLIEQIEQSSYHILQASTPTNARFKDKIHPYASKGCSDMVDQLQQACKDLDLPFLSGITISSPGFYGPSGRYIEGLKNTVPDIKLKLAALQVGPHQAINMEMESSLIFHLGHQLGLRCGTICPIISNPSKSDQIIDYQRCIEQTIEAGLKAMLHCVN